MNREGSKRQYTNRREFLFGTAATVGASVLPESAEASIIRNQDQEPPWTTIPECPTAGYVVECKPEYEAELQKVFFAPEFIDPKEFSGYQKIVEQLPPYTTIIAVVSTTDEAKGRRLLKNFKRPIQLYIVDDSQFISRDTQFTWAQDFAETIAIDGQQKMLLPMTVPPYGEFSVKDKNGNARNAYRTSQRKAEIEQVLGAAFPAEDLIKARFYFEGGNLTFDKKNGQKLVYTSFDTIQMTIDIYDKHGLYLTPDEVCVIIKEDLQVDEVVVLGEHSLYGAPAFHIDQYVTFLKPGVAAVTDYHGPLEDSSDLAVQTVLTQIAAVQMSLAKRGYQIIPLPLSDDHFEAKAPFPTNGIPFTHQGTKRPYFLMPVSAKEQRRDKAAIDQRCQTLSNHGIEPIVVTDKFYARSGSTHCVTNVLARQAIVHEQILA